MYTKAWKGRVVRLEENAMVNRVSDAIETTRPRVGFARTRYTSSAGAVVCHDLDKFITHTDGTLKHIFTWGAKLRDPR